MSEDRIHVVETLDDATRLLQTLSRPGTWSFSPTTSRTRISRWRTRLAPRAVTPAFPGR